MLCLSIMGFEADPDRVTDLLQIMPTRVARKGTASRSGRAHASNAWWLESHEAPLTDGSQHVSALGNIIHQLQGRADHFARLREELNPSTISIYGGLYLQSDEQCGVWLEPEQMCLLAACGITWGLDLFVKDGC